MVSAIARLYAPSKEPDLLAAFRSTKNQTIQENGFSFTYTYDRGPAIDERLITVTRP
ncbi:hypothetical protein [Microvirga aerophila]|uniref:Uncharacterized protein n=1 Tax=Microvirga aerophila TaxID=670291 RepID=A0A512C4G0_9HYPH|nr:hypothetical protein [Microvirga aerophila]GEO19103.1 hypothetical protein MAE02_67990 [Microvirga aerophila]